MAKKFACRDIGMNCGFEAKANTEAELMTKITAHAKSAHNMSSVDANTMRAIKAAIKTE
jgi:predicted small metal-binding protein